MTQLQGEEKQRYVAEMFARIARRYDRMNTLMTGGMHHRWKRETARLTAQGLRGGALDIATGTGDLAFYLAENPSIANVIGLDFIPEMIDLAQDKVKARRLTERVTMIVGDALALPFPDNSFACVTAGFSLRNMPDLRQALAEMARVARPGGRVTTLDLSPMKKGVKSALFGVYFNHLVPLMGQLVAGDRSAYTYLPQSVVQFMEADRLADMCRELGLIEVGYRKLGFGTVALHWGIKPN